MAYSEIMKDKKGYLSEESIQRIISTETNVRNKLLLKTLWLTGARIEEITGGILIRTEIIKDKLGNIIEKKAYKIHCSGFIPMCIEEKNEQLILPLLKKSGKTISSRQVPTPISFIKELKEYIVENNIKETDRIFPICRVRAFQIVKNAGINAGFSKIGFNERWLHPHLFRHSLAIHLRRSGMSIEKIRDFFEHSSVGVTGFYLKFGSSEMEQDYRKIMGN